MNTKLMAFAAVLVAGIGFLIINTSTATAAETRPEANDNKKDAYAYTAKEGDSYSVLARKAVQTYGLVNKVRLSQAQIIAAETDLTSAANFPWLDQGQAVKFNETHVKTAVDSANKLSPEQQTAWEVYVSYVEFDTRSNG